MGETMSVKSENNKRIAKNTFLLYFRMLFTMGVSLYTSRVVLNTLGVEDFGIYNVVGGVVVMFSFLNSSLATATPTLPELRNGARQCPKAGEGFFDCVDRALPDRTVRHSVGRDDRTMVRQHPIGNPGRTHTRSIVGLPIFDPDSGRFDHQRPV